MFKLNHQPLTRAIALVLFITLALSLSACGADKNVQAKSNFTSQPQAKISLRPAPDNAELLEIWVDNVEDLYALELELKFDPAAIQLADANAEQDGLQIQPGQSPAPDFIAVNSGDNQSGVVRYVVTQVAPRQGFSGSGVVATLLLKEQGSQNDISFTKVILVKQDGQPIQAQAQIQLPAQSEG